MNDWLMHVSNTFMNESLKSQFDSQTCTTVKGTPAIDIAPPCGLGYNYTNVFTCPVTTQKVLPRFPDATTSSITPSLHLLLLAQWFL